MDRTRTRWMLVVCACVGAVAAACSEVPKYRPLDGGGDGGSQGEVGGATDSGGGDSPADASCTCPGGFACVAGVCNTTCATSTDCHPDYFCDPGNHACHSDVVSVATGNAHGCAALKDGRVVCWGDNSRGQLGIGLTGDGRTSPVVTMVLTDGLTLAADDYDTCAVTAEENLYCWGGGNYSGTGHTDPAPVVVKTVVGEALTGVKLVSIGSGVACAVAMGGTYCWGGLGGSTPASPTLVTGAGMPTSIAVSLSAKIFSYGDERICPWSGAAPPQSQCFSAGSVVSDLASTTITSFARLVTGVVIGWGSNNLGFLGPSIAQDDVSPPGITVDGLNAASLTASYVSICAVPSGAPRSVLCWGGGKGVPMESIPIVLGTGLMVTKLGSGAKSYAVCAIVSDGALQCMTAGDVFKSVPANW